MNANFKINGIEFCINDFSNRSKEIYKGLIYTKHRLQKLQNQHAVLSKARNEYISALNNDIILKRSGVDLSLLFTEGGE